MHILYVRGSSFYTFATGLITRAFKSISKKRDHVLSFTMSSIDASTHRGAGSLASSSISQDASSSVPQTAPLKRSVSPRSKIFTTHAHPKVFGEAGRIEVEEEISVIAPSSDSRWRY